MSCWIAAQAIERDVARIPIDHPALWREIRRFNLPVKLALAAAQRVIGLISHPNHARLLALAPCRPGSPELRAISRDLDAGFARGSCDKLRVNPIYTLHAIDNLALSALAIRIENHEPSVCFGGAAGQAFAALELALDELDRPGAEDVLIFGGDQSDSSWRGEPSLDRARETTRDAAHAAARANDRTDDACGAAVVLTARPQRARLIAIERARDEGAHAAAPHAARGLAGWLETIGAAPPGTHRYRVPPRDGDGIDRIEIVVEVR